MSLAGARASQGYSYQTLVALRWAVKMLSDPEVAAVEIESTSLDPSGLPIVVDDVVVYSKSDSRIYCQCKKNQEDFRPWRLSDAIVKDELVKCLGQIRRDPVGTIHFYSRTDFGLLRKLAEYSRIFPHLGEFEDGLTRELEPEFSALLRALNCDAEVGLSLLQRIEFEVTSGFAAYADEIRQNLSVHVNSANTAFDILYSRLDQASAKFPAGVGHGRPAHRFTRNDSLEILVDAGVVVVPPRSEAELLEIFRLASAVGRHWRREIGGRRIPRAALGLVKDCIDSRARTVLVTDDPGSGKTCLLLDLVEQLEREATKGILFIQGREYADCTSEDRLTARGLPADVVGHVARLADFRHTVVIIDSLDVLSLNRKHGALRLFLTIIDRLERIANVTTIATCRSFDLKYDHHLAGRSWDCELSIDPLDWERDVQPLMEEWQVPHTTFKETLRQLLINPRHLALYEQIAKRGVVPNAATTQELTSTYLDTVVRRDTALGQPAIECLSNLAANMVAERRLDIPLVRANLPEPFRERLLSAGVIIETNPGSLAFSHQTVMDTLAVQAAEAAGQTLLDFIRAHPALPFVRPAVRVFFFELRFHDPKFFRRQIRSVLDADDVAFHIKRLAAESLAEVSPTPDDWPLVRHLFNTHTTLFDRFFNRTREISWLDFLAVHWLPEVKANCSDRWVQAFAQKLQVWMNDKPEISVAFWRDALSWQWVNTGRLSDSLSIVLDRFTAWSTTGIDELFRLLVAAPRAKHDLVGHVLSRWVDATNSGDDLLWSYISSEITPDVCLSHSIDSKLRCQPHVFHRKDFIQRRMNDSEHLLDMAIDAIESWAVACWGDVQDRNVLREMFIHKSSWERMHSRHSVHRVDSLSVLLNAVEAACLSHAERNSKWWQKREPKLRNSPEGTFRYFALRCYNAYPETNVAGIQATLLDAEMLRGQFEHEIGQVIHAAFPLLDITTQTACQESILALYVDKVAVDNGEEIPTWVLKHRRDLISWIPAWLRIPEAQAFLDSSRERLNADERTPHIWSWGGRVDAPITAEEMLTLTDEGILKLADHYTKFNERDISDKMLVGGGREISQELRRAASLDPERFLALLRREWIYLSDRDRIAFLAGAADHMRYRFGRLGSGAPWQPLSTPDGPVLAHRALDVLEAATWFWKGRLEAAHALEACAEVVDDLECAGRITFLLFDFLSAIDPQFGDRNDDELISIAINSTRGIAAQAAGKLASRLVETGKRIPELLPPLLLRFSDDPHPAVRAAMVQQLPFLQYHLPKLGWRLFDKALSAPTPKLWELTEQCLYYAYSKQFDRVGHYLDRMAREAIPSAGEAWGRIATLASVDGHLSKDNLFEKLRTLSSEDAWAGATQIFASNVDKHDIQKQCIEGLERILVEALGSKRVIREFRNAFRDEEHGVDLPLSLIQGFLNALAEDKDNCDLFGFLEWMVCFADRNPADALPVVEAFATFISNHECSLWHHGGFSSLLTTLFREADDRDDPAYTERVVRVQDALLMHGAYGLDDWLTEAERP